MKKRRKPTTPVVLLRPAIIIAAKEEPFPGWTDTISAAGGLTMVGGIGLLHYA